MAHAMPAQRPPVWPFSSIPFLALDEFSRLSRMRRAMPPLLTRRPPQSLPGFPALVRILDELDSGGWRIRTETAHALGHLFAQANPSLVLEFGSGVSTVVFAALAAASGPDVRVVSIDEHARYAERTRTLLRRFQLSAFACVITAPVRAAALPGWRGYTYALAAQQPAALELARAMHGAKADLVFIDGPASLRPWRRDCRFGTLLQARRWCGADTLFIADDAARSRDLAILRRWQTLPFIDVLGVIPVGRGLGVGRLQGAAADDSAVDRHAGAAVGSGYAPGLA
jgi:hypothetical protein